MGVGTTGGTYFKFRMTSQIEAQKITSFKLTATSSGGSLATSTLQNIQLLENGTPVQSIGQLSCAAGTCTYTWVSANNILSNAVPTTGTEITVKADIGAAGSADLGDSFKFVIASTSDVVAKGATTGAAGTVSGTPTASGITYVVPFQVSVEGVSPLVATNVGLGAGQVVGVFKVTNGGSSPIYLASTTFANGGSSTSTMTYELYASAPGGSSGDTTYAYATSTSVAFGDLLSQALAPTEANRTIPGGSWRYLTIKTLGAADNNNTFQLSVSALGALKFYVKESDLGYSGNPSVDSNVSGTINSLYINGIPSLSTVTAKT